MHRHLEHQISSIKFSMKSVSMERLFEFVDVDIFFIFSENLVKVREV